MIAIQPRFKLGQVVATQGALAALNENKMSAWTLLSRHLSGDYGSVDEHDRKANEQTIGDGSRIFSAHVLRTSRNYGLSQPLPMIGGIEKVPVS